MPLKISLVRAKKLLRDMAGKRIAVIGDYMLDEYIWGEVERISPEAPVPVVRVNDKTVRLGGAANVAHNLSCLGLKPEGVGLYGADGPGRILKNLMKKSGVKSKYMIRVRGGVTTQKTRIIARQQQVVRVDHEQVKPATPAQIKRVLSFLKNQGKDLKGVILSDYGKGLLSPALTKACLNFCADHGIFTAVDPKHRDFSLYARAGVITPNFNEFKLSVNQDRVSESEIDKLAGRLIRENSLGSLLVTFGRRGMRLFESGKNPIHMETMGRKVFDVTGAGDTVISTYTAAMACGATPGEAMALANHAAGLVIREVGTATVSPEDLLKSISGKA